MAPHGARLSDIKTAESHPIALRQCSITLTGLNIEPVIVFDTAGAARSVAEAGDKSRAAVAPTVPPRSMTCRFCATIFRTWPIIGRVSSCSAQNRLDAARSLRPVRRMALPQAIAATFTARVFAVSGLYAYGFRYAG